MNDGILATMEYHPDWAILVRTGRNMEIVLNAGGEAAGEFSAEIPSTRISAGGITRPYRIQDHGF